MLIGICDNSKQSRTKLVNICAKLNEFNILTFSTPNEPVSYTHLDDLVCQSACVINMMGGNDHNFPLRYFLNEIPESH